MLLPKESFIMSSSVWYGSRELINYPRGISNPNISQILLLGSRDLKE